MRQVSRQFLIRFPGYGFNWKALSFKGLRRFLVSVSKQVSGFLQLRFPETQNLIWKANFETLILQGFARVLGFQTYLTKIPRFSELETQSLPNVQMYFNRFPDTPSPYGREDNSLSRGKVEGFAFYFTAQQTQNQGGQS